MAKQILLFSMVILTFCRIASALEPSPLQDFCVADPTGSANPFDSAVTPVTVAQQLGLNTLEISMVRIDIAPWRIVPPHTHLQATEILTVLEGTLQVEFLTSNPDNTQITKVLQKGDVFVFPVGLIHFQRNVGKVNVVAIAALSSQNSGVIPIANTVFGSKPAMSSDILAKAF